MRNFRRLKNFILFLFLFFFSFFFQDVPAIKFLRQLSFLISRCSFRSSWALLPDFLCVPRSPCRVVSVLERSPISSVRPEGYPSRSLARLRGCRPYCSVGSGTVCFSISLCAGGKQKKYPGLGLPILTAVQSLYCRFLYKASSDNLCPTRILSSAAT